MSRFGKCQNLSGCLLAYRGEETEVEDGQPFICAECGKPLAEVKSPAAFWMRYAYGAVAVLVVIGIAFAVSPGLRGMIVKAKGHDKEEHRGSREPVSDAGTAPADTGAGSPAADTGNPTAAEPPRFVTSPQRIDLDITRDENKAVKADVLTRVDQMPNVSGNNKDKLYMAVEKAKKMGKIITIPFNSGKSELSATDIQQLKTQLEKPEVQALRSEPSLVFVILGYADPKGDARKNIAISEARADTVRKTMKDKCEVQNVMHTVGMGGSKLVDAQNLEKNRIVEIWAVIP
jgi:outer membrane protein OmpA-like peptidoglycan-associated protein